MPNVSVNLIKNVRISGVEYASGTTVSVDRSLAAALINNNQAARPADWELYLNEDAAGGGGGKFPEYIGPITARSNLTQFYTAGSQYIKDTSTFIATDTTDVLQAIWSTVNSTGENAAITGTLTVSAFVTYKGQSAWLTFNEGQQTATANYNEHLYSDLTQLPFTINEGEEFSITGYGRQISTGSGRYTYHTDSPRWQHGASSGHASQFSATELPELTLGEAVVHSGGYRAACWRPVAVLGKTTKRTVFIGGDSLNHGMGGNTVDEQSVRGWYSGMLTRFFGKLGIGVINCAVSGDDYFTASQAGKYAKRGQLSVHCTDVVSAYGVNDLGAGSTIPLSSLQSYINLWFGSLPNSENQRLVHTTITHRALNYPIDSSAKREAYRATPQTTASNASRWILNEAIRGKSNSILTGISAYLETCFLESKQNNGLNAWPTSARTISVSMTAGSNVLTSSDLTPGDVNSSIQIPGAGTAGALFGGFVGWDSANSRYVLYANDNKDVANAVVSVTDAQCPIGYWDWYLDGLHFSRFGADENVRRMIAAGEGAKFV